GSASNIVPEMASGHFVVRAPHREGLTMLRQRVEECFQAGALAAGAKVDIAWEDIEYFELVTNWPLAAAYQSNAESLGRQFVLTDTLPPNQASSTDMGNISHIVPVIHPMIA